MKKERKLTPFTSESALGITKRKFHREMYQQHKEIQNITAIQGLNRGMLRDLGKVSIPNNILLNIEITNTCFSFIIL